MRISPSSVVYFTGPKSPGLIILEHDTSDAAVDAFISAYPHIKANGWRFVSQAELPNGAGAVYQNEDDQGNVTPKAVAAKLALPSSPTTSATSQPPLTLK